MAKYEVHFSCGHAETIQLFGKESERQRRIEYYEKHGICSHCYAAHREIEKSRGCIAKEMPYRLYKTEYADCKTKAGSYNSDTKTIVVYIHADEAE